MAPPITSKFIKEALPIVKMMKEMLRLCLMKTLDRYILTRFVKMLLIFLAGTIFIFIIVNFFERIDKFVSQKVSPIIVLKYYGYQIPYLVSLLFPVAHILASFFSIGEMARKNELLAIKASGINVLRVFLILLLLGLLNSGIALLFNQSLSPEGLRRSREIYQVEVMKRPPRFGRVYAEKLTFWGRSNRFFYFGTISSKKNLATKIIVMEFEDHMLKRRIDARKGVYGKEGWIFFKVTERIFKGDVPEVKFYDEKKFPEIKEKPFDFLKSSKEIEEMNITDLLKEIKLKKMAGIDYTEPLVELHTRIAFPFANFVILLFSLPLAASLRGRGRAYGFGLAVMFSFLYWTIMQFSKALGQVGKLPPPVSAWAPNIIFFVFALLALRKAHR